MKTTARSLPLLARLTVLSLGVAAAANVGAAGHRVHIEGRGESTVVFASGLGDTLEVWQDVQPAVASQCARTVTYNRAGYPGSEPARGLRDAATVVAELRSELRRRNVAPPYVLIGHSLGGLYMQYFARKHPGEIAGLVLVDSTHWDEQLQMGAPNRPRARNSTVVLFMPLIAQREMAGSAKAGAEVSASPKAQHIPTIVLSSTAAPHGETPASRTRAARLQEEIVASFPGARHIRVDGAGHYIQRDRPAAVIDAARELAGCTQAQ